MPEHLNENTRLIGRHGDVDVKGRRNGVRAYMLANAFEWMLAGQALLTALLFFTTSNPSSAVGVASPTLGYIWNGLYALAALTIILGMLRLSIQLEAAGLVVLVSAATINIIAIAILTPLWALFASYGLIVVACAVRLRVLIKIVRIAERAQRAWQARHDELE